MSSFFGGGDEKWGMKDEKNNDRRGIWGAKQPEHFDDRFINEILNPRSPPPPFGVGFFS